MKNLLQGFHKHHLIPKHLGGSDDPSNLVLLHPIDHMILHWVNYRFYGRWEDAAAAKVLGGALKTPMNFNSGASNGMFKGAILATDKNTGKETLFIGRNALTTAGFDQANVYKCIAGKRKQHKNHTFKRIFL